MSYLKLTLLILYTSIWCCTQAQKDSTVASIQQLPAKYWRTVDDKARQYSGRVTAKTEKTLVRLSRWEEKIHGLLLKTSPAAAARLFAPGQSTFSTLLQKLKQGEAAEAGYKATYDSYRDKLTTSLQYIATQKDSIVSKLKQAEQAKDQLTSLDQDVANSEATEKFIRARKKQLFDQSLQYLGKCKYLTRINKESYYYIQTLKNYKELFSDPGKAEEAARDILNRLPGFQQFMQQNSALASLFGAPSVDGSRASLAGLQTRASVNSLIQDRLAAGGPNAMAQFQQNMQEAQSQLSALKDKVLKAGGSTGDMDIPDFRPNMEKTKTFKQRLEKGFNLQFAKPASFSATTTADLGVSLGYKLNEKNVAGIGFSYKLGVGSIQHIRFSHQGVGLRSYIDWQLKKQFYISGGYELNHYAAFKKLSQLTDIDAWQPAGLIGISKKLSIKTKFSKQTKLQLMYDVLYRSHLPVTSPWVYRIGYNF